MSKSRYFLWFGYFLVVIYEPPKYFRLFSLFQNSERHCTMESLAGFQPKDPSFATRAIHASQNPDKHSYGPVVAPLYNSTTFKQDAPGKHRVRFVFFYP